jgi:cytoskeleton protein RodZ
MAGIGSTLREARMRQHLDIVDLEARTKIRGKYLRALEDEEWALLPGYTFVKGFLRTYADMLGLDGRALVDEFKRQYRDPSDVDAATPLPGRREGRRAPSDHGRDRGDRGRGRGGGPPAALVVFVIAVVLAAVLYFVGLQGNGGKTGTTGTLSTPSQTTRTTSTTHTHTRTTPAAPTRVSLRLAPTGTVYVCLVGYSTPSNTRAHMRLNGVILTSASHEPIYHADDHFLVTFGNASIAYYVDGHRHAVPASSAAISYSIGLGGRIHRLSAAQAPRCA